MNDDAKMSERQQSGGLNESNDRKKNPPNKKERLILEGLKRGNTHDFEELYLQWRKPVYMLMLKILRNETDAEDITQDVFETLWNTRERIDTESRISTYIFLIARQSAIRLLNRERLKNTFLAEPISETGLTADSYELLVAKESEILIEYAIERMPAKQREVYRLCYKEGLSNQEIAERLGISQENVRSHIRYAKQHLREILTMIFIVFFAQ